MVQAACLYRTGQPEKAIELIMSQASLKDPQPGGCSPWAILALANHSLGKTEEARRWLTKVEDWFDAKRKNATGSEQPILDEYRHPLAFSVIFYREAKRVIDKKDLKDDPRWKAIQDHNRGWLSKREPATAAYDLAVALAPYRSYTWLARARHHAEHRRAKEADADFARAVAVKPKDPQTWKLRGQVYAELGRYDEAAADFVKALDLAPIDPVRWDMDRGGILSAILQSDEVYQRVQRQRPKDRALLINRLRHLGSRGKWREAARVVPRLIELTPDSGGAKIWVIPVLLETGDHAGHRRLCEDLHRLYRKSINPGDGVPVAISCLLTREIQGDPEIVRQFAERAMTGKETWQWGALTLALIDMRTGNNQEAIRRLRSLQPKDYGRDFDATVFMVLAMAQHHRKQADEARKSLGIARAILERRWKDLDRGCLLGPSLHWVHWLRCRILFREAQALIEGKKPAP